MLRHLAIPQHHINCQLSAHQHIYCYRLCHVSYQASLLVRRVFSPKMRRTSRMHSHPSNPPQHQSASRPPGRRAIYQFFTHQDTRGRAGHIRFSSVLLIVRHILIFQMRRTLKMRSLFKSPPVHQGASRCQEHTLIYRLSVHQAISESVVQALSICNNTRSLTLLEIAMRRTFSKTFSF
jgi:hypothetical protein